MSSSSTMTLMGAEEYRLSLALAERLRTIRYTCPWHPNGSVAEPAPAFLSGMRCRVLLFPSGQACRARLTPVVPPYAADLGLVAGVLVAHGGSWAPVADPETLVVRVTVPGGPPEGFLGPVDGPEAIARLICHSLIEALHAKREDFHG